MQAQHSLSSAFTRYKLIRCKAGGSQLVTNTINAFQLRSCYFYTQNIPCHNMTFGDGGDGGDAVLVCFSSSQVDWWIAPIQPTHAGF